MASSHRRRRGRDITVLSSWRCEHNWRPDKTVLSCLQLCSHRQDDKTRQFCRVSNCVHTANAHSPKLGRDETKLSCRRCEHNWQRDKTVLSRLQLCSHRQRALIKTESRRTKLSCVVACEQCIRLDLWPGRRPKTSVDLSTRAGH